MSNKRCIKVRLQYLERGYKAGRSTSRANCFALLLSGFPSLRSGPILAVLINFLLLAPAKIGPDTNSLAFVLTAARFWPQRWLAVGTMPQDLIGCWNQRKLKAFLPRLADSTKKDFALFFIVLRSCGRKIYLNMCHGNSQNSNSCPYSSKFLLHLPN